MSAPATGRRAVVFVESNTSGTGRLFVLAARELGYHPVLLTANPAKYAFLAQPGAPEVIAVPHTDEEALHQVIVERFDGGAGVAGVTSSSEYFVATAAALAARLGRAGPDAAAVRAARDKSHQRRVLAAAGLPTPAFRVVASAPEAVWAARETGVPVVVKPVAGSGSVGVRACATSAEAGRHAASLVSQAVMNGGDRRMLVEEMVTGPEFSVEVFSGRVVGITRKHLGAPPAFVEAGHDYPADVSDEVAAALADTVVRGTALLGLGWGPLHWELRVDAHGRAVPMEVNPRLAGGFIPELVRHAQGIDLVRETVRLVVGETPDVGAVRDRHASIRFLFAPSAGRLREVDGVGDARSLDAVEEVALYRAAGDELAIEGDFRDRIGHVIACADGSAAACDAAERGRSAVRIGVQAAGAPAVRAVAIPAAAILQGVA